MNRIERNKRMAEDILAGYTVLWVHGEGDTNPSLHDSDGDLIVELWPGMVDVLDRTNEVDALTIILTLAQSCQLVDTKAFDRGLKSGQRVGRAEIVGTVHELLGIDRLSKALDMIDDRLTEIRGS